MKPETQNQLYEELPLSAIILSGDNKRKVNHKSDDIQELASSISGGGVTEPIQVMPDPKQKDKFILISGERRFVASKEAGMETIPAIVRYNVTNVKRVELMSIENMFRKNLKPLEEAEEIDLWMERLNGDAEAIAKRLGKSIRWVRLRVNVIKNLSKDWHKIFEHHDEYPKFKDWSLGHLILIARLPGHLQSELYKAMTSPHAQPEYLSIPDLEQQIGSIMNLLSKAKWDLADETLCPKEGSCLKCEKRTGHQPMLWFDNEQQAGTKDQCMDPVCFQTKLMSWLARQKKSLTEKHPNLVLIAKEYPTNTQARFYEETLGSFHQHWQYQVTPKNNKQAIPAMFIDGGQAGKLVYVTIKKEESTSDGQRRRKGTGQPTPLKVRQAMLDAKRWAQVLVDLIEIVKSTTVSDLTWKDKSRGLMVTAAVYGNEEVLMCHKERQTKLSIVLKASDGQNQADELLWESLKPTMRKLLTWSGPVTQTPASVIAEAKWIAPLIGRDVEVMFKDVSERPGFTVPKSWSNLNADGTPKADKPAKKAAPKPVAKKGKGGTPKAAKVKKAVA